jgi:hypothetical protein
MEEKTKAKHIKCHMSGVRRRRQHINFLCHLLFYCQPPDERRSALVDVMDERLLGISSLPSRRPQGPKPISLFTQIHANLMTRQNINYFNQRLRQKQEERIKAKELQ